jgi:hypothetical protein
MDIGSDVKRCVIVEKMRLKETNLAAVAKSRREAAVFAIIGNPTSKSES